MTVALEVLLPLPLAAMSFLPPPELPAPAVGQRVAVPWQGGARLGVVAGLAEVGASRGLELRHALHAYGTPGWLTAPGLGTVARLARASGAAPGTVLATLGVPGLAPELVHEVRLQAGALTALADMPELAGDPADTPPADAGAWSGASSLPLKALEFLRRQGLLEERVRELPRMRRVLAPARPPDAALEGKGRAAQRAALEYSREVGESASAAALARDAGVSVSSVRTLVAKGYLEYVEREEEASPMPLPFLADGAGLGGGEPLPDAPVTVVVGGSSHGRLTALLATLRAELAAGRSAVVLAPDQARAEHVASLLGSHLPTSLLTGAATDEQRVALWGELATSDEARVLVGTFLALLAPVPRLGRVVVLDHGSGAYKLQSGSRTRVPAAAAALAELAGSRLTLEDVCLSPELAAAAPSEARRELPLPRMRLHVAALGAGADWPVHPDLMLTLRQVAERGRQAVVLAPRRGFSGAYGCPDCGWLAPCPNCDLTLRYHRTDGRLRCHQCGHDEAPPDVCPDCGSSQLGALRGAGTEWVLGQLRKALPGTTCYRYDRDQKDDLTAVYAGEPAVVVGTLAVLQLDAFPRLSLIGITQFDAHLAASDYRAEADAARTLLRLAELGGSRAPLLVVQTYSPEQELLVALGSDERDVAFARLVEDQLERRRRFSYPPYGALAKAQFTARDLATASEAARFAAESLAQSGAEPAELLGPVSAPVGRVRRRFVYHLLLRAASQDRLEELIALLPRKYPGARLIVDADPQDVGAFLD